MTLSRRGLLLATAAVLAAGAVHAADAPTAPYTVDVWADATFDKEGRIQKLDVPDDGTAPPAFVERLRKQFASARIPAVKAADGSPATFQTGMRIALLITPGEQGAATAKVTGMGLGPRPVKRYFASRPAEAPADGVVSVEVTCTVGVDGQCSDVRTLNTRAGSESLRRWGVASLKGWQFVPQRVNDEPVPGEFTVVLGLESIDAQPRNFRDPRKL